MVRRIQAPSKLQGRCHLKHRRKCDGGAPAFGLGVLDSNDFPYDPPLHKSFKPISNYRALQKIDVARSLPLPVALFLTLQAMHQLCNKRALNL